METPIEKPVASCARCWCYVKTNVVQAAITGKIGTGEQGQCHRFPPQIVSVSHKTIEGMALIPGGMFPQVSADWWCMEFRARPEKDPKPPAH